jgi:O-antigen/teichoic acid export membrane protein
VGIERQVAPSTSRGHALLYMAPTIVQAVIPLVTLPIFTRVLSREEYGLWAIATAVGALVAGTLGLGLQVGFERNYFAAPDDSARGKLLYSVLLFAAASQLLGFLVLLMFAPSIARRFMESATHSNLIVLAFLVSAVGSLKMFFLTVLRNQERARDYAKFSIDELVLGAAISLVCVLWLRTGVAGLLIGPLLGSTAVTVALIVWFAKRVRFGIDGAQLRDTLQVSLPLAPRALLGAAGNQLDRLVLGAVGSLASVGVYAVGQRMAQLVFAFMTSLQSVYQPSVYRMLFAGDSPRAIGSYLMPFAYASTAVAAGVIVFANEIVSVIAAPEFGQAGLILGILSVHYGLMFFGKQPQLAFARRTDIVSWLSVVSILMNAASIYVGVKMGGAVGAAWGMLAAGVVSGSLALVVATRFAPISYPAFPTLLVFGALPLALIVALLIDALMLHILVGLAVKSLVVLSIAAAGWRTGFIAAVWNGRRGGLPHSI